MGSVQFPKLSKLSKKIWQWCENRDLYIFASYIKSADNIEADKESRILTEKTEWSLSQAVFQKICYNFGLFDIDLFATRINAKYKKFISWMPDPEAINIDAFTISWTPFYFYAFPPFNLILRVLRKIRRDCATDVVVVPNWPKQDWFPMFMNMKISKIFYFEPNKNLFSSPFRDAFPTWDKLTLAIAILSGKPSVNEDY